jgi:plasmid stabilization system protein ParE
MTYTLLVKSDAEQDVADAADYYDQRQTGLGDQFLAAVRDTLATLKSNPFVSAKVYREVRQTSVPRFPFVVSYFIAGDRIVVIAVLHGRRDPRGWKSRMDH